ncbi:MAG: hypothetical protein HZB25_04230 [Candidatus Eisenbacteria bacterium]|nr:hypothetical protein [Candidatus Eisenbacteria bacterium]
MGPDRKTSHLDQAYLALESEQWGEAAELARNALAQAVRTREEADAALARFILGTALVGPEDVAPEKRIEARAHLQAALPRLEAEDEPDLAGQAWSLLGSLSLLECRGGGRDAALVEADSCYRHAIEAFSRGDYAAGRSGALHNLGLCLVARAETQGLSPRERDVHLDQAITCFHDALELELEYGLHDMAEATEDERRRAQGFRDAVRGWGI